MAFGSVERLGASALGALLSSCLATTSILGTPRTVGHGNAQAVPAIGYETQGSYGSSTLFGSSVTPPPYSNQQMPTFEVVGRKGITDNFDLGLRLYTFGVGAEAKLALVQTPYDQSGIDLAIAPTGQVNLLGSSASLPVLVGYHYVGGNELVLSPRAMVTHAFPVAGDAELWVGAGLGFAVKVSKAISLLPEIAVLYPAVGAPKSSTTVPTSFQAAFGVILGGDGPAEPPPPLALPPGTLARPPEPPAPQL